MLARINRKSPLVVNARQNYVLPPADHSCLFLLRTLILWYSCLRSCLCLHFWSQNKAMCSPTLTSETCKITGGIILPVQDPLILTKIRSKWNIYTNQYTLKCMVCQGKPSRTCFLIFIKKKKKLKIYLFLTNAERYGEGNVTWNLNVTALILSLQNRIFKENHKTV